MMRSSVKNFISPRGVVALLVFSGVMSLGIGAHKVLAMPPIYAHSGIHAVSIAELQKDAPARVFMADWRGRRDYRDGYTDGRIDGREMSRRWGMWDEWGNDCRRGHRWACDEMRRRGWNGRWDGYRDGYGWDRHRRGALNIILGNSFGW